MKRGSDILAYTVSYGHRNHLQRTVSLARGAAGLWMDWAVWLGNPSAEAQSTAEGLLADPQRLGIQYLTVWPDNRGQHHATTEALKIAREQGYKWLLRWDDDVTPKTKKLVAKMIERLEEMKRLTDDKHYRLIAAPKVLGLKNPLRPVGTMLKGQNFTIDLMEKLGGAVRLHNVEFLQKYTPDLYDPVGRGDPEQLLTYCEKYAGYLVRFPDIRVVHNTQELEAADSHEQAHSRKMGKYWPFLGDFA
jgi:hypothetical protein